MISRDLAFLLVVTGALMIAFVARAQSAPFSVTSGGASAGACSSTTAGLVPATGGGTANFLRADCTFAAPAAGVTTTGSPVSGEITRFSAASTITGDTSYTDNGTTLNYNHAGNTIANFNDTSNTARGIVEASDPWGSVNIEHCGGAMAPLGGPFLPGMGLLQSSGEFAFVGIQPTGATTQQGLWGFWFSSTGDPTTAARTGTIDARANPIALSNGTDAASPIARSSAKFSTVDVTTTTAGLVDLTGLSVALTVGAWDCETDAALQDSTTADGITFALTFGGTATTSTGVAQITQDTAGGAAVLTSTSAQASVPTAGAATFVSGIGHAHVMLVVSVAGNLKTQFGQNTHSTGTATAYKGAELKCLRL